MLSFENVWPIKRIAVYILLHFHIFIHYLDQIRSKLAYFFATTYLILANLQVVAGSKKLLEMVNFTGYHLIRRTLTELEQEGLHWSSAHSLTLYLW